MVTINKSSSAAAKPKRKAPAAADRGVCVPTAAMKADEARWRAESDLRTMQQMAELKADPSRIRAAEAALKAQLKAIQAVKGR